MNLTCTILAAAMSRTRTLRLGLLAGLALSLSAPAHSQAPATPSGTPPGTPQSWMAAAADNELHIIDDDGSFPLRFRTRKVDAKGDTTREVIESRDGSVARLIERNGQPLSAAEDAAERQRLLDSLDAPAAFLKHHKRDASTRGYAMSLVRLMPQAMIYTYTPGQPQLPNATSPQVVIDFQPDPNFKPPTMIAGLLTGIEGRFWIDQRSQRVTRAEAHVTRAVDFGWGMLARIYPGGTIAFEQADAGNGRWVYSRLDEHLTMREVLVKTATQNTTMTSTGFRLLPAPLSYQDAIHVLLDMHLPTH